ncbi:MAG: hypothetical protein J2P30_18915 [Actinobacteria bacterium]|nr:hypothetical protein [Actinomycetota bacterium]
MLPQSLLQKMLGTEFFTRTVGGSGYAAAGRKSKALPVADRLPVLALPAAAGAAQRACRAGVTDLRDGILGRP